jgi:serine/threonine protein kinase
MTRPPEVKSLVGYTIGKCVLQRICGRGAMGTVYQGMHTGLDIDVAVKVLPPHLSSNASLVQRFLREAKLAAKLNHANTVRVYDVGEESGYYYLVMEFVKGNDALDLIKTHGPLDAATVADIGTGAAKALAHAHAEGVVHRDIKPANLMLPETGGVKVADFGLARATASDSGLTMTGAIMGTPDYMAPEQAQGKQAGATADAYSLGGTLFHLFVGRPPFSASTPMAVALQHVTSRITVPQERLKTPADRALAQIIHELTEKEPESRLVDMHVVAERLSGIARMSRNTTQKLMSEGATLFATAGFRIDTRAIEKAKVDAINEMHAMQETLDGGSQAPTMPPSRPLPKPATKPPTQANPMLDELRKVGAEVRSKVTQISEGPAAGITQDLADLTPELVREAKARARRSSGAIPALPPGLGETGRAPSGRQQPIADKPSERPGSVRRSSGSLPPIGDELPGSASRRSKVAAGSDAEDHGWEEYSAKSFPTLDRPQGGSTAKGPDAIAAPWDNKPNPSASGATRVFDGPPQRYTPKKRSSSSGAGVLIVLLLLGGVGVGVWYKFFRKGADGADGGQGSVAAVALTVNDIAAHKDGTGVLAVAALSDGKSMLTSGLDGSVHLWRAPFDKPAASNSSGSYQIRIMAPDQENGSNFAALTSNQRVLLVDNEKLTHTELFKADKLTTLHWPRGGQVVAGDALGKLWRSTVPGKLVSKKNARINALASRRDELYVATVGGEVLILDVTTLNETRSYNLSEGSVEAVAASDKGVFVIVAGQLRPLVINGLGAAQVAVEGNWLTFTGDGALLVVLSGGAITYVDPASLKVVGSLPLPAGATLSALGPAPGNLGVAAGTARGRVLHFTGK